MLSFFKTTLKRILRIRKKNSLIGQLQRLCQSKGNALGAPRIYYFSPDTDNPSWGMGLIYKHVELLNKNNLDAFVLHGKPGFRMTWMSNDVPIVYMSEKSTTIAPQDILVLPEVVASQEPVRELACRKIVFIQNAFLMLKQSSVETDYSRLGFEHAITIMPHLRRIIPKFHGVDTSIIPCCLNKPFRQPLKIGTVKERKKQILIYPKKNSKDYIILKKVLDFETSRTPSILEGWKIIELKGKSHVEVAALMRESALFVNVNCYEAFNTSVPEAMASGCAVLCYEAFGGRDFLVNGKNAFVYQNNEIYPLIGKLLEIVEGYEKYYGLLDCMREVAYSQMSEYTEKKTEQALLEFFKQRL